MYRSKKSRIASSNFFKKISREFTEIHEKGTRSVRGKPAIQYIVSIKTLGKANYNVVDIKNPARMSETIQNILKEHKIPGQVKMRDSGMFVDSERIVIIPQKWYVTREGEKMPLEKSAAGRYLIFFKGGKDRAINKILRELEKERK